MAWINEAIVETRVEREERESRCLVEKQRVVGVSVAREAAGLKKYNIKQAEDWIDEQIDSATNTAETVQALRTILKKMIPSLLD